LHNPAADSSDVEPSQDYLVRIEWRKRENCRTKLHRDRSPGRRASSRRPTPAIHLQRRATWTGTILAADEVAAITLQDGELTAVLYPHRVEAGPRLSDHVLSCCRGHSHKQRFQPKG
jgi:hypothetical protein